MSFSYDRPNLKDRIRGKSGEELMEEMLKNMKQSNKKFFDHPKWKSSGFSFDDGLDREGSAGSSRSNLKSHLADLVARHPELADSFVDLLPEDRSTDSQENRQKKNTQQTTPESNHPTKTATQGTQTGGLESDIKLRNTVPDMQSSSAQHCGQSDSDDRSQRSQSAPPQSNSSLPPSKQKEEGMRHNPIRTDSPIAEHEFPTRLPQGYFPQANSHNFQHPSYFPQNSQHHQEQKSQDDKGPTIRHIPIFVEGRDEPIIPKEAAPSGMKRGGCQGKAESTPGKKSAPPPPPADKQHQTEQPQQQQAPPHQPPAKPDPLSQVAVVLKEVEELAVKVNEWNGTSRSEKEYIYLDEMLTRNLLKLDNVETEGREEIRNARKDVIRRIQAAISVLESKTAEGSVGNNQNQQGKVEESCEDPAGASEEPMETDAAVLENKLSAPNQTV